MNCLDPTCKLKEDMLNFMLHSQLAMIKGLASGRYFLMSIHGDICQKGDYATPQEALEAYQSGKDTGK